MADAPDNCQFCGHDRTYILNGPVEDDWCAVTCDKCHARGPINYTDPHAIAAWNTRTTPPAVVVEAMERALRGFVHGYTYETDRIVAAFYDAETAIADLQAWRAGK